MREVGLAVIPMGYLNKVTVTKVKGDRAALASPPRGPLWGSIPRRRGAGSPAAVPSSGVSQALDVMRFRAPCRSQGNSITGSFVFFWFHFWLWRRVPV